jgi:hypothetical protein
MRRVAPIEATQSIDFVGGEGGGGGGGGHAVKSSVFPKSLESEIRRMKSSLP